MYGLYYILEKNDITVTQLAFELGITDSAVRYWKNTKVPTSRLEQLAEKFNVPKEYIGKELTEKEQKMVDQYLVKTNYSDVTQNLREYYSNKYGSMPIDEMGQLKRLIEVYKRLMGKPVDKDVREGISEYYRQVKSRDLNAYLWLMEAFHVCSKKELHKRNFSYVVGTLRNWLTFGFGHIPSQDETDLEEIFEEKFGYKMSDRSRILFKKMLGQHGAIKLTKAFYSANIKEPDMSYYILEKLEGKIK